MNKYNNRFLWRTYLFIVCFSIISAGAFLYLKWADIKHVAGAEQTYANNLVSNSMESLLRKNETMLQVLGERLVEVLQLNQSSEAQALIDSVLSHNKELAGVGLANPQGDLILTSLNIDRHNLPNLLTTTQTTKTFKQALSSHHLIMGRTYYMKALDEWLIPIRIAIRDKSNQVVAVMTAGFRLGAAHSLWSSDNLPDHQRLVIVRSDMYRQYVSFIDEPQYKDWYAERVPEKFVAYVDNAFREQTGLSLSDIRTGWEMATVVLPNKTGEINVATISYDPGYGHYTIVTTPLASLYQKLVSPASWMLAMLALFNIGLYLIFRLNGRMQSEAKQSLRHQVEHDSLTALPNRRFLSREFQSWSQMHHGQFSLLYVDLKNFKACNDLHGHSTGDQVLCEAAKRITASFENCLCVRQGGDEFIILCPVIDLHPLTDLCQTFLQVLTQTITVYQLEFSIHASIGIALSPVDGENMDELLRKADMAMYEGKAKHRDITFYSADLEKKAKQTADIEKELINALRRDEFFMVYQPQVDALTNQVLGVEALIRWQNPALGFVPSDQFIAVAESTGSIHDIGKYVAETALSECAKTCEEASAFLSCQLRLSVNVSVRQLLSDGFITSLKKMYEKYTSNKFTFMIEVTESLFIEDMGKAKAVLEQARECGIYVSLDDFGTGYSFLSVLSKLPINELKIDRSFVNDILTNEQDWLLAKSIINLSKSLSIPVIAEGVETREQADMLAKHGCDLFQGYYFAKPMKKDDLVNFLGERQDKLSDEGI